MHIPFQDADFWAFFNSNQQGQSTIFEGIEDQFSIAVDSKSLDWSDVDRFLSKHQNRDIVVALSYELNQHIESLERQNTSDSRYTFPQIILVVPKSKGLVQDESRLVDWSYGNHPKDVLLNTSLNQILAKTEAVNIQPRFSEEEYVRRANFLLDHIFKGDIYEVNFCQEFVAENAEINPWTVFLELNQRTEAPYSACMKWGDNWLLSGSPERYLQKNGQRILSSPIKGTIARSTHEQEDLDLALQLKSSVKERAENVMIVDLVRNDLSRIAQKSSVVVEELCAIKSFKTVHHMVSTVAAELKQGVGFSDILRASFPMGSMTGAPKISAMNLAAEAEGQTRGIYSGAVGYIKPGGDFVLNVVIRSLVYQAQHKYLSFHTGSALTAACDPRAEYKECLLKAKALVESVNGRLVSAT